MAKTINLTDFLKSYGKHTIKVRCRAEGFRNSDYATTEVENLPVIKYDSTNNAIQVYNLLTDVTTYTLNIYDKEGTTLLYTQEYTNDGSSTSVSLDLSSFELTAGTVYTFEVAVVENDTTYTSASVKSSQVFGVSGLYAEAYELTRTDDAEGKSFTITTNGNYGEVSSDFDDVFPYNQMVRETDSNGNVFVYVPAIWWRIGVDSSNNIMDIACSENEITTDSPTGTTTYSIQTNAFYYGAYQGYVSSSKLYSKSGVTPTASTTRANFRTYAAANSLSGYTHCQLDLYHKTILNFLWLIEFANKSSDHLASGVLGGFSSKHGTTYSACCTTGNTDGMSTPTGYYYNSSSTTARYQMRYRYIEDFVGNMFEFYDGCYYTKYANFTENGTTYYTDNDTGKDTISAYTPQSKGQNINALGWDSSNPFVCMPSVTAANTNYDTYFCDYGYSPNSSYPICYGGTSWAYSGAINGVFYVDSYDLGYARASLGGRLLKLPA